MSQPWKKKRKRKSPAGPDLSASPSPSSLFSPARRGTRRQSPANLVRRATCRPSSHSVPPLRSSLAPSPYPRRARPVPLQTLAESAPKSAIVAAGRAPVAADSPPSVSGSSIPRGESFFPLPSLGFAPNPAPSPSLQSRRRAPRSAAAPARRAAPPPPLLARATAGELHYHLRIAVRTPPFPLWPRPVAPLRAAAVKAGLALTQLGGPLARGPRLSAPGLAGWGCT